MITIKVSKEEVRKHAEYESNRYKIEITREVDDPGMLKQVMNETWDSIRHSIEGQKSLDGGGKDGV